MTRRADLLPGDLACWMRAAYPQPHGRLDIALAAHTLEVSASTVRRWLDNPNADTKRLNRAQLATLRRRAILRGKGHYLWPRVEHAVTERENLTRGIAATSARTIARTPAEVNPAWTAQRWLKPHVVALAYYRHAHVWQVYATQAEHITSHRERINRHAAEHGALVAAGHRFDAILGCYAILDAVGSARCVVPGTMVDGGRSFCWRETGPNFTDEQLAELTSIAITENGAPR